MVLLLLLLARLHSCLVTPEIMKAVLVTLVLVLSIVQVSTSFGSGGGDTSALSDPAAAFAARDGWGWGASSHSSSFFDVALTALAFMSFGIFLLNLLMNALLAANGPTATGPIITDIGGITGGGAGGGIDTGGGGVTPPTPPEGLIYLRRKRSTFQPHLSPTTSANILAATVLNSIEAMVERHECISEMYCEGNRRAQLIGRGFQYIMPMFSFGTAYIGQRLGFHKAMPQHLEAILEGVSESNCKAKFPQCKKRGTL